MVHACMAALTAFLAAPEPTTRPAADRIKVTPVAVVERRPRLTREAGSSFHGLDGTLTVVLSVEGRPLADATRYGRVVITEGVDDVGTTLDLADDPSPDGAREMKSIDSISAGIYRAWSLFGSRQKRGGLVELSLTLPPRKATRIRRLRGEFQVLAQGRPTTLSLPGLKGMIGKSIDDPLLKSVGAQITVIDAQEARRRYQFFDQSENMVCLKVSGSLDHIGEISVLNKEGSKAGDRRSTSYVNNVQIWGLPLNRPIDDNLRLKIEVFADQKRVIVPFDLSDLELP